MKILILTEFFPSSIGKFFTGGVESRVYHIYEYLKRNHTVEVWSITSGYSFNSFSLLCRRLSYFVSNIFKIVTYQGKIDIVEGTNATTFFLAYFLARRVGAKAVAWVPDLLGLSGIRYVGLLNGIAISFWEKLSMRFKWDGVIALSEETKKKLIKAGINTKKIKTIYGGVNYNFYKNYKDYPKFKPPTLICIARLVKYKRVRDLLLAIYFLQERFRDIRAIIVGDGPEFHKLKVNSEQLKITDRIRFLSSVSEKEKWELLARSHIHVLPSVVEGFGLATIEALAAGTPVVNADIPINREILRSRESGVRSKAEGGSLFKSGDAADLAEKIEILLTDKKLYNRKVSEGRELVKKYGWEKVNEQTEEFYQSLLSD